MSNHSITAATPLKVEVLSKQGRREIYKAKREELVAAMKLRTGPSIAGCKDHWEAAQ